MKEVMPNVSITVELADNKRDIINKINSTLSNIKKIYSCIVYRNYDKDKIKNVIIKCNIHCNNKYNTIDLNNITEEIINAIHKSYQDNDISKKYIYYKQPLIEIMYAVYKPLLQTIATEQVHKWNKLEYEDVLQICYFVMFDLYKQGYYINKKLLRKSIDNYILMTLRKSRTPIKIISIEETFTHKDGDDLIILDTLVDKSMENQEIKLEREILFNAVKEIILQMFSQREFDKILKDYGEGHTDSTSICIMRAVRKRFAQKGITIKKLLEE